MIIHVLDLFKQSFTICVGFALVDSSPNMIKRKGAVGCFKVFIQYSRRRTDENANLTFRIVVSCVIDSPSSAAYLG
jgi:hypothetical protein